MRNKYLMTLASLFELGSMYLQFMNLAMSVRVNWSPKWDIYISILKLFSFDFNSLSLFIPNYDFRSIPVNEPRHDFLSKAACIPLLISILMVFFYKTQMTLIWFIFLLCGISATIVGGVVASEVPDLPINGIYILYIGIAVILLMLIIFVSLKVRELYESKQLKENTETDKIKKIKTVRIEDVTDFEAISKDIESLKKSRIKRIRMGLLCSVCLVVCVFSTLWLLRVWDPLNYDYSLFFFLGATLFGPIGFLAMVNFLGNFSKRGRTIFTKLNSFVRKSSLKLVLVLLALIYMPINTVLLKFIVCKPFTCGSGQMITRTDSEAYISSILFTAFVPRSENGATPTCTPCVMDDQCPSDMKVQMCGGETDSLLAIDPTLSCTKEILPYFVPAVILMIFSFTFGIPFLYYRLVKLVNVFLQKVKVIESRDDPWIIRIRASKNSCSQMYNVYYYKWRYFKLMLIWYRLLIISFFVFLSTLSLNKEAIIGMLGVHLFSLLFSLYNSSYFQHSNQVVLYSTIILNIVTCSLVYRKIVNNDVPDDLALPLSILNLLLPVAAFVVGFVWDKFDKSNTMKKDPGLVTKKMQISSLIKGRLKKCLAIVFKKNLDEGNGDEKGNPTINEKSTKVTLFTRIWSAGTYIITSRIYPGDQITAAEIKEENETRKNDTKVKEDALLLKESFVIYKDIQANDKEERFDEFKHSPVLAKIESQEIQLSKNLGNGTIRTIRRQVPVIEVREEEVVYDSTSAHTSDTESLVDNFVNTSLPKFDIFSESFDTQSRRPSNVTSGTRNPGIRASITEKEKRESLVNKSTKSAKMINETDFEVFTELSTHLATNPRKSSYNAAKSFVVQESFKNVEKNDLPKTIIGSKEGN